MPIWFIFILVFEFGVLIGVAWGCIKTPLHAGPIPRKRLPLSERRRLYDD